MGRIDNWKRGFLKMTSSVKHWSKEKIAKYNEQESAFIYDDLPNRELICIVNKHHLNYEQNVKSIQHNPQMIQLMIMLAFDENAHIDLIRQTAYNLLSKTKGPFFTLGRNEIGEFEQRKYLLDSLLDDKCFDWNEVYKVVPNNGRDVVVILRKSEVVDKLNAMLCKQTFHSEHSVEQNHSQTVPLF